MNDLPYKSDRMVQIVFPDECYKKLSLTAYSKMEFERSAHVNDNSLCGAAFTVNGDALRCRCINYTHIHKVNIETPSAFIYLTESQLL